MKKEELIKENESLRSQLEESCKERALREVYKEYISDPTQEIIDAKYTYRQVFEEALRRKKKYIAEAAN